MQRAKIGSKIVAARAEAAMKTSETILATSRIRRYVGHALNIQPGNVSEHLKRHCLVTADTPACRVAQNLMVLCHVRSSRSIASVQI